MKYQRYGNQYSGPRHSYASLFVHLSIRTTRYSSNMFTQLLTRHSYAAQRFGPIPWFTEQKKINYSNVLKRLYVYFKRFRTLLSADSHPTSPPLQMFVFICLLLAAFCTLSIIQVSYKLRVILYYIIDILCYFHLYI